ncbi:ribosomal lysine N-methyltransferase 3 [Cornus florida]|uniref:ribosomal lysine N-methyltransferase 3 n=1 Tax=Cornus florida TaxID=4283 RepID=UPI0028A12F06|nr:ribosomal lysine N-methyltransferase 3 [Cornus florida]
MAARRMRAFKRWMRWQCIDCSDALELVDEYDEELEEGGGSICVRAVCDLHEEDLVATIPKQSCLTIKTSRASHLIEAAGLDGLLGLSVALMYEKSLGEDSPWFGYLQLLPHSEYCTPLLWTLEQIDSLLSGTELHKIVEEDKALICEDWKECILPLLASAPLELNPDFFGIEQYFAARSLIASRSFEIDDYHGFGMVPLADLFNHKTGAEDVHFTTVSSHLEPDNDAEDEDKNEYDNAGDGESLDQNLEEDEPTVLEMIIVKDVKAGAEVFNTYGSLGNAALLHRYGFTEPDNPYDIVNIGLELVHKWSSSLFSGRHSRSRLSFWRKLGYSGCISQNSEYFEISYEGEPQVELLILLYIILLPDEAYRQLDLANATMGNSNKSIGIIISKKGEISMEKAPEMSKGLLLTGSVCDALWSLAGMRDSCYGSNSVEDDIRALERCCWVRERKLYYSLVLRVSERRILDKLGIYAETAKKASMKK